MIEIYYNRLEISSPGIPIISADRFIDGYQSRNERLAGSCAACASVKRGAAESTR